MKPQYLPDKLRLFVLNSTTRNVTQGVALSATINLNIEVQDMNNPKKPSPVSRNNDIHLGVLASDHAGYISFDLKPFKKFLTILYKSLAKINQSTITLDVNSIRVSSPFYTDFSQELLPYLIDIDPDAAEYFHFFKPNAISVLVPSNLNFLSNCSLKGLQSIQNPDVSDWKTSPDSFGMAGLPAIGESGCGCETLLPSRSSDRVFRFYQMKRFASVNTDKLIGDDGSELKYKRGKLIEYEMLWHPINHGLGQIQYSLTLAPGEGTKIAVIEWDRKDEATRSEKTGLSESLLHEQKHNRIVDEAVEAAIKEYQRGKSFMGGTAGVGGYGGQGSGSMWGVTGSHSLGVADTSSEGNRNLEGQSMQQLNDIVAQASSSLRDLRSTVIVQANQSERELLQTRSIRNYNHSHALTILYYEVVRHYCISTRAVKEQDLIFIKNKIFEFLSDVELRDFITKHKSLLVENLLDKNLVSSLNLAEIDWEFERREVDFLKNGFVDRLIVRIGTGDDNADDDRVKIAIINQSGKIYSVRLGQPGTGEVFDTPQYWGFGIDFFEANSTNTFEVKEISIEHPGTNTAPLRENLKLNDIYEIGIIFNAEEGGQTWKGKSLKVLAAINYNDETRIFNLVDVTNTEGTIFSFSNDSEIFFPVNIPDYKPLELLFISKYRKWEHLMKHFQQNKVFYSNLVHLNENPDERMIRLEEFEYSYLTTNSSGDEITLDGRLFDFINPQPIDVIGNYIAYKVGEIKSIPDEEIEPSERIISLPTRGLFAEAQLSHCNASEIIDDTRFWDWQISPIPDEAPEISGVSPTSRYRDIISTPTGLPNSNISIEGAPDAPSPSALSQIIDAVTKSDIFRDMSAKAELASILNELTKAAAGVEQQRMQSLTELAKQDAETERARLQADTNSREDGTTGSSSSSGSIGNTGSAGSSSPGAEQSHTPTDEIPSARDTSTDIALIERTEPDPVQRQEEIRQVRQTRTGARGERTITVDLKYGNQDLNGDFSITCYNRGSVTSDDALEENRRTASSGLGPTSLSLPIPYSWSTVNVEVTINSLIIVNHLLLDSVTDFQRFIEARSTSSSIYDEDIPDSGHRLYEYPTPIPISRVVSFEDSISRNLVCRYDEQHETIEVERVRTSEREDEWNFSGNLGFEDKIVLGISGGQISSETLGESTTIRKTLTVRYIDPSQPRITQGREE